MISGMTDIHQHLLWGLDDGAQTPESMQQMLLEAHHQGIVQVAATCHVCPGMTPFDPGLYRERLREANDYCRRQGLAVNVLPGAEVAWTYQAVNALRQRKAPRLGDTDYVLLELWPDISLQEARQAVRSLIAAGYCPVLAHVERYRCFSWFLQQALRFREETGALFQMNARTLLQPRNLMEKRFVTRMLESRAIDAVATDAHGNPVRPINLLAAREWLEINTDPTYARELTTFGGALG